MVSVKVIFFFFFLLNLLLVAAVPMVPSANTTVPKLMERTYTTRILYCQDKHWRGYCDIQESQNGICGTSQFATNPVKKKKA